MIERTAAHPRQRTGPMLALGAWLVMTTACATNHEFIRGEPLDVPSMVRKLEAQTASEDEDALFEVAYFPFTHADLKVFARNDDTDHYPEGHIFFSARSWLPLFGIVDGHVEHYDTDHAAYEKTAFRSILWGLWTRTRTTVATHHGPRSERNGRFLWLFDWGPRVDYEGPAEGQACGRASDPTASCRSDSRKRGGQEEEAAASSQEKPDGARSLRRRVTLSFAPEGVADTG